MEITLELIKAVATVIGDIPTNNKGMIDYPGQLRNEISQALLEKIAKAAVITVLALQKVPV